MKKEIEQVTAIYETIVNFLVTYSFQLIGAIFIFFVGVLVARKVANWVLKLCAKHDLDSTLSSFIASTVKIAIITMISIMALGKIGISVTPLLATVGALSLGAGLAVQGLVSNYGAGLSIIVSRPFVVGDTIEVNHVKGLVKEVHLGYTLLIDEDDIEILVPNRHIVGEVIKNSYADTLIECSISVCYGQSPDKAVELITHTLTNSGLLSPNRPIRVGIDNFGDSGINIGIRVWAATLRYYSTKFEVNQLIYNTLLQEGVEVPFPRMDVQLLKD